MHNARDEKSREKSDSENGGTAGHCSERGEGKSIGGSLNGGDARLQRLNRIADRIMHLYPQQAQIAARKHSSKTVADDSVASPPSLRRMSDGFGQQRLAQQRSKPPMRAS